MTSCKFNIHFIVSRRLLFCSQTQFLPDLNVGTELMMWVVIKTGLVIRKHRNVDNLHVWSWYVTHSSIASFVIMSYRITFHHLPSHIRSSCLMFVSIQSGGTTFFLSFSILYCFMKVNKLKYQQNGAPASNGSKHQATRSDVKPLPKKIFHKGTYIILVKRALA